MVHTINIAFYFIDVLCTFNVGQGNFVHGHAMLVFGCNYLQNILLCMGIGRVEDN